MSSQGSSNVAQPGDLRGLQSPRLAITSRKFNPKYKSLKHVLNLICKRG